jgi:acetyl esterase
MSTQLPKSDRPGRLGDPDMSLSTDPRTNPQLLRTLEQFGMDVNAEAAPVSADSSYEDCLAFTVEMEAGYEAIYGPLHQNLPDLDVVRELRSTLYRSSSRRRNGVSNG